MMATPRDVLLIWVKAALEAGSSERRPSSKNGSARQRIEELEHLALALQANQDEQP